MDSVSRRKVECDVRVLHAFFDLHRKKKIMRTFYNTFQFFNFANFVYVYECSYYVFFCLT